MAHDGTELRQERRAGLDQLARGRHQILLVVPGGAEPEVHEPVDANDLARPGTLRGEHGERGLVEVGELVVRGDQRLFRSRMRRDPANITPGSVTRTRRTAAATTGVETGRRPAAANPGAARSSANRYVVRKLTPMRPTPAAETGPNSPDASRRRTATPTELPGTTTVTGASGDSCFAPRSHRAALRWPRARRQW